MTGVSTKRATPTYACDTPPPQMGCKAFNSRLKGLRWKKEEDPWRAGEHPTISINANVTLTHLNPSKVDNDDKRWTPEREGEQPQHPTTILMGQPGIHTEPTPKAPPWRGTVSMMTTGRPSICPQGGSWILALDDDASTDTNVPAPCLHLVTTTQHAQHPTTWKPLLYSSEQLLNDRM